MRALIGVMTLFLAGCATDKPFGPSIEPASVIIYRDVITVQMSDRSLCVAERPELSQDWTGRLTGCPHDWAVLVQGHAGLPPRVPLGPADTDGSANVTLTNGDGTNFRYAIAAFRPVLNISGDS